MSIKIPSSSTPLDHHLKNSPHGHYSCPNEAFCFHRSRLKETLPTCGHELRYTAAKASLTRRSFSKDNWAKKRKKREKGAADQGGEQRARVRSLSAATEEPRAMNLINSAACELMLFLLRVAAWIIEIRVLCEIWRDSQLQMAYYPISSRNSAANIPGRLPKFSSYTHC